MSLLPLDNPEHNHMARPLQAAIEAARNARLQEYDLIELVADIEEVYGMYSEFLRAELYRLLKDAWYKARRNRIQYEAAVKQTFGRLEFDKNAGKAFAKTAAQRLSMFEYGDAIDVDALNLRFTAWPEYLKAIDEAAAVLNDTVKSV